MKKIQNYIGGKFCAPIAGLYVDNYSPENGNVYSLVPDSDVQDIDLAVCEATNAFGMWSTMPSELRSSHILKLADALEQEIEAFALAESLDTGKPLALARSMDIPRAVQNLRFFATAILHQHTETHATDQYTLNYTLRQPLGVVACISPWNLPLYLFTWKIAPALAAGNCVIAKPSELAPMTAYMLAELCYKIGFPDGVLNIVQGRGAKAGDALVNHSEIKAVSFTGGTNTGGIIAQNLAPKFKKISLELGGKNAFIAFQDCDYEQMLATAVRSAFTNQGQICLCGSRFLIEKSIYQRFKKDFVSEVQKLKVGNPRSQDTNIGALISLQHQQKVLQYIDLAKQEGGQVLTGGHIVELEGELANGYYIAPTVVENLKYDCRTNQEEVFGPLVTIQPFDDEKQMLQYANSVRYGLATSLWTNHLSRAHTLAQKLETGIVWVNCWLVRDLRTPFGGMKDSGLGREGGWEALHFFTEPKNICIRF